LILQNTEKKLVRTTTIKNCNMPIFQNNQGELASGTTKHLNPCY